MGDYIKGFGRAAGHFFSRMWFAAVSFTSGAGLVMRVLGALVVMFSLPISVPMILLGSVVVGLVNARKQSQQLKQRDAAIKELSELIPNLEAELLDKTEQHLALRSELHNNRDLISTHLAELEALSLLKEKSKLLKEAIENHLRQMRRSGVDSSAFIDELSDIIAQPKSSLSDTVNQLVNFTTKNNIAVDFSHIKTSVFTHKADITKPMKNIESTESHLSTWQRIKLNCKKAWGPISFGLGSAMLLMLTLHGIGLATAIPTGGASLLINIAASAAFGVGSGIMFTAYQSPHNKKHASLVAKKTNLEERSVSISSKIKRLQKKNDIALREAKNYELLSKNTENDIEQNFKGLAKDIQVHQNTPDYETKKSLLSAPPNPTPAKDIDSELTTLINGLSDVEKQQLLETLRDAKRPSLRPPLR